MEFIGTIIVLILLGFFIAYMVLLYWVIAAGWDYLLLASAISLTGCFLTCILHWVLGKKRVSKALRVNLNEGSNRFLIPADSWCEVFPFHSLTWSLFFIGGGAFLFFMFNAPEDLRWYDNTHFLMKANVHILVPYVLLSLALNSMVGIPLARSIFRRKTEKPFKNLVKAVFNTNTSINENYLTSVNVKVTQSFLPLPNPETMFKGFFEDIQRMDPFQTTASFLKFKNNMELYTQVLIPEIVAASNLFVAVSETANMPQFQHHSRLITLEIRRIRRNAGKSFNEGDALWDLDFQSYLKRIGNMQTELKKLHKLLTHFASGCVKIETVEKGISRITGKINLFAAEEIRGHFSDGLNILKTTMFNSSLFSPSEPENLLDTILYHIQKLEVCAELALKTNKKLAFATKSAVKVLASNMICLVEEILEALVSDEMGLLLCTGEFTTYSEILVGMDETLEAIIEQVGPQKNSRSKTETPRDPFKILNLVKGASALQIKKQYRTLSRCYHPDMASSTTPEIQKLAEEKFKEINWAYKTLQAA